MFDNELKTLCRKLKPVAGKHADMLWLAYATADRGDEKAQISAMIQAMAAEYLGKEVDTDDILLPPPSRKDSDGEFAIGALVYRGILGDTLHLTRENFQKHIGVFGITGSGKTVVTQGLILRLLDANIPVMIIDWKRSYRHINDERLHVFSIGRKSEQSINWNPLRGPPGVHPKTWIATIAEVLEKSHLSGPGAGDIFIEILDRKFEEHGFYDDTQKTYPNFFDVAYELKKMTTKGRRSLWQDTAERITRTLSFGPAAGAFNARNPIPLEALLNKPVIFELDQELPRSLRTFFSEVVLRFIHLWRLQQGESSELRHVLILEEIHNLFTKNPMDRSSGSGLETVFREIRSFGQGLIGVTQHPSLLPTFLLGNTNTLIMMALQHAEDVEAARKALFLEKGDERYFSLLKVGEGIVRIQGRIAPTLVRFPLVGKEHAAA